MRHGWGLSIALGVVVVVAAGLWAGSCRWSMPWAAPMVARWASQRLQVPVKIDGLQVVPWREIVAENVEIQLPKVGRVAIDRVTVRYNVSGSRWVAQGIQISPIGFSAGSGSRIDELKWTLHERSGVFYLDQIRGLAPRVRLHGAGQMERPKAIRIWVRGQAHRSWLAGWGVRMKRSGWEPFYLRLELGRQQPRFHLKSRFLTFSYGVKEAL